MTEQAPLVNPENANTSTTLTARALEDLPNPGGDLTYPLQFAAGALINTAGSGNDFVGGTNGYGNVQFNGLPSLSNGYIVDGLETNDPLTNLNSGLSTNLVLGLNSIAEVTVNTLSYAVDQGRYGAAQVNYVTKSGHESISREPVRVVERLAVQCGGFLHQLNAGKPQTAFDGQPLRRQSGRAHPCATSCSSFSIPNGCELRFPSSRPPPCQRRHFRITSCSSSRGEARIPSPDRYTSRAATGAVLPEAVLALRQYGGNAAGGSGLPVQQRWKRRRAAIPPNGNGCANRQSVSHSSDDSEQVQTARIDYNIDEKNMAWFRFQADTGLQAAYTDPINPLFNAISPQPLYSFAAGYTHVFSPDLVNYFNPAFSWYESLFGPADLQKTLAAFPIVLQGSGANAPFTTLGGLDNTWVQGRRAARFFINDNLAWTAGAHELRFGTNSRIFRLNDYDFGEGTVPLVTLHDPAAVHLRRCVDRFGDLSAGEFAAVQFPESGLLCAGHLEDHADADLDFRSPRHLQFKSAESA